MSDPSFIEKLEALGLELNCASQFDQGMLCYEAAEYLRQLEEEKEQAYWEGFESGTADD